jgi:hypothetical protein
VIPALISATVALVIFIFTQWILYRRERTKLLLGKLEELYLLLLEFAKRNGQRFERLIEYQPPDDPEDSDSFSFSEWFGIDLGQKLELYVDFYFPSLRNDLEKVYETNRHANSIIARRASGSLTYHAMQRPFVDVGESVATLRKQILTERPLLTRQLFPQISEFCDRLCYG